MTLPLGPISTLERSKLHLLLHSVVLGDEVLVSKICLVPIDFLSLEYSPRQNFLLGSRRSVFNETSQPVSHKRPPSNDGLCSPRRRNLELLRSFYTTVVAVRGQHTMHVAGAFLEAAKGGRGHRASHEALDVIC